MIEPNRITNKFSYRFVKRFLDIVFAILLIIILFPFADEIYTRLAAPLIASLPTGSNMSSSILFYLGAAFAYFIVFPLIFAFFVSIAPEGIAVMTDIGRYLDFVITLFFAFGFAFEVPIVTIMLVYTNATTKERLIKKRPYVIVGAFTIGMLLTPPDVISQTLLAIPIWILYELGIFFSRFVKPQQYDENEDELVDDLSVVEKNDEKNDN